MKLQKEVIPLRALGYNGKFDSKIAPSGMFSVAENVQALRRTGEGTVEIKKRFGFTEVPGGKAIDGGGSIAACVTGAAYNDELVLLDGGKFYSRSDVLGKWIAKGKLQSIAADIFTISGNETIVGYDGTNANVAPPQPNTDVAYQDGYACFATSTNGDDPSQGSSRVYVRDQTTGEIVVSATLGVNDHRAKVLGLASSFYVFTWNPVLTKLQCRRIQTSAPSTIGSPVDIATNAFGPGTYGSTAGRGIYDVTVDVTGTRMWITYRNSSSQLSIKSVTTAPAVGVSNTYTGVDPNLTIGFLKHDFANGSGYIGMGIDAGATREVRVITFQTSDGAETANTAIHTGYSDTAEIPHVTGYRSSGGVLNTFWTLGGAIPFSLYEIVGKSGATEFQVCLGVNLASRAFTSGGKWYLVVNYTGEEPASSRLLILELPENSTGLAGEVSPAGLLLLSDACDPPVSASHLPSVPLVSGVSFIHAAPAILNEVANNVAASTTHFALDMIALDLGGAGLGTPTKYNDLLHIPCAAHKTYDGKDVIEAAFYVDPEGVTDLAVGTAPGGGIELEPDKTYQYCVTWARFDALGRIHRSSPGPVNSFTTPPSGTEPDPQIEGNIIPLRFTDADPRYNINPDVTKPRIELWRTEGDLDVFYLCKIMDNDATTDAIAFADALPDVELVTHEILYTQSEELDNQKVPAAKVARAFQSRLFLLTGDGSTWFTKESAEGFGAEFSDTFRILLVDGEGSRPTALGSIDASLVLFKRKRAFITSGAGPDDKGAGQPFPVPQPLQIDLGVVNATGAVDVPGGIMCETSEGRFTLTRALQFEAVEGTEDQTVTVVGGVGLDSRSMTAFVTNGSILCRDWQLSQWFVWSKTAAGLAGVTICRSRGALHVFQADGTVLREVANQYFDGTSTPINEAVEFTYTRLENARIYQLRIVGEIMSTTTLTETVTYNGNSTTAASKTKAVTTANHDDLNVYPNTGRMSSIKVRLEETSTGEGFKLSQIGLEVGAKVGLKKSAAANNFS